jgi:DNA helicase HerA-like ATPase
VSYESSGTWAGSKLGTFWPRAAEDRYRMGKTTSLHLPAHHLVTHGVIAGMTGSGKTGLVMVLVEEALRAKVPVLAIDVKGDLPTLLLSFPTFAASEMLPWAAAAAPAVDARSPEERWRRSGGAG